MAERLLLEIVTPRHKVVELEVDEVRVPGVVGELGVLPGHTPLLTTLGIGALTYRVGSEPRVLAVQGGFVEVLAERVTVLAAVAEAPDEIDVEGARQQVTSAEEALVTATADDLEELMISLRMAQTRLEVAGTRGR